MRYVPSHPAVGHRTIPHGPLRLRTKSEGSVRSLPADQLAALAALPAKLLGIHSAQGPSGFQTPGISASPGGVELVSGAGLRPSRATPVSRDRRPTAGLAAAPPERRPVRFSLRACARRPDNREDGRSPADLQLDLLGMVNERLHRGMSTSGDIIGRSFSPGAAHGARFL